MQIIKVKAPLEKASGDTYPHRDTLKLMGCTWNSQEKHWERKKAFFKEEMESLINLGLKIQHTKLNLTIEFEITSIRDISMKKKDSQVFSCIGYIKECESMRSFVRENGTNLSYGSESIDVI